MKLSNSNWQIHTAPEIGGGILSTRFKGIDILRPYDSTRSEIAPLCLSNFPLVPYSNRIAEGQFEFQGRKVVLSSPIQNDRHALHGAGWLAHWDTKHAYSSDCQLSYSHKGENWPWTFQAEQRFKLTDTGLSLELHITNTDETTQPVGLGFHLYFLRRPQTRLHFNASGVWMGPEPGLSKRLEPLTDMYDFQTGKLIPETTIDLCFEGWDGSAQIDWPDIDLSVYIRAEQVIRHAVLFTPENEDFFCFEPVSHVSNAIHLMNKGIDTGLRSLAPGETFSASITLTVSSLSGGSDGSN